MWSVFLNAAYSTMIMSLQGMSPEKVSVLCLLALATFVIAVVPSVPLGSVLHVSSISMESAHAFFVAILVTDVPRVSLAQQGRAQVSVLQKQHIIGT